MQSNIDRFSGYADAYDAVRPQLPPVGLDVICDALGTASPAMVVDLGAGTGLSSRLWIGRATRIVGVEPNDDMRGQAVSVTAPGAVEYIKGLAEATGLPDRSADIVTVGQALHWMDAPATFAEAARILRDGGVFAAYDCDWPPFVHWQLNGAWRDLRETSERIVRERGLAPGLKRGDKSTYVTAMRQSGLFRDVSELCFHMRTAGNAESFVKLMRSQGGLATTLKANDEEARAAFAQFSATVQSALGDRVAPWTFTYRMRLGVK